MNTEFVVRLIGMAVMAFVGWRVGSIWAGEPPTSYIYCAASSLAGAGLGLWLTPWVTTRPAKWLRRQIHQLSAQQLVAAVVGLVIGLVIAALFTLPLSRLPAPLGSVLPFVAALIFAYLGVTAMLMRHEDILKLARTMFAKEGPVGQDNHVLLDTSVIIDGRIADISQTGFISGTMLVPRFILNELQHIADSSDALRRNRGRRGLDMLNRLQKESTTPVRIIDMDVKGAHEVDDKLVMLAKKLGCPIITNDYNLNRVAKLQGVTVLNINELANAVKPIVLPGESMKVHIIQEGKELGQGVGYLDDGTMVVVEDGRRHIGHTINVTVTKVLQTAVGRMIFARPEEKSSQR